MPEPKEGESKDDFMARCIPMVMEEGTAKDNDQAVAICMAKFERKSVEPDAVKIGAEISRANHAKIQAAHDALSELGATCKVQAEVVEMPIMSLDADGVVAFGEAIKATRIEGGVKVGGYLIRFTPAGDLDLTGDRFDTDTDFDVELPGHKSAYFHHGLDVRVGKRKIGTADLRRDDFGIWAETILQERDEYEKFIAELALAGKLGWSSGTAGHLMERQPEGKGNKITRWPIVEASLTHTPAEPRNVIAPMKSLITVTGTGAQPVATDAEPIVVSNFSEVEMEAEELKTLVSETVKGVLPEVVKAAVEEIKRAEPANVKAGGNISVVTDEADQPWEQPGKFFLAVKAAASGRIDPRLKAHDVKVSGMSEGVPADGGYLLPKQVASGILEKMYSTGALLSRITIDPVTGNSITMNAADETSRIAGSRLGGVRGYWLSEAGTLTSSKPKFRQMELKLKKVGALCYATDEQLEDTANLESWLGRVVPDELRFMVEDAIYEGDGVGKPYGFKSANGTVSVTRLDASKIQFEDLSKMWMRRYPYANDYVWFINQDCGNQLDSLVLASSTEIPLRFVQFDNQGVLRIKGAPVIEVEYASSLGTVGDIVLASMSHYQAISKGGVKAASSIHVAFTTDETAFRFTYRIDGQPMWDTALTPFKGSSTISPFVTLSTSS